MNGSQPVRKFLVVVDKTAECCVAVRFAARRAQHTGGRVTLLCVAAPVDFQQWKGVEEIMKESGSDRKAALKAAARERGITRREAYKQLLVTRDE